MRGAKHEGIVKMSAAVKNSKQPKAQQAHQAHQATQAQCNAQAGRGKVTTRCLWNACKALSVGLFLLCFGTTMAVIGYYADQLSIRSETRGNSTVKIKNESRGFHLNNLSYAGPIVMGIGGFIVVAACVMTFEARDNAAKVVPARFKPNLNSSLQGESSKSTPRNSRTFQRGESKRNTSAQTPAARCPALHRLDTSEDWSPKNDPEGRKAFTAAFVWFSRELMEGTAAEGSRRGRRRASEAALNKSPSAPDLAGSGSNAGGSGGREAGAGSARKSPPKASPRTVNRSQREGLRPQDTAAGNLLLRPSHLQRQAVSMDNPFYEYYDCFTPPSARLSRQQSKRSAGSGESVEVELGSGAGAGGSQVSMALDLHDCQVTLKVKDESASKRSDTARRHQLLRQKPVEDDREEKPGRCSCAPRFLCTPAVEESALGTKSGTCLKSPCHHCSKVTCCGRVHVPKMSAASRSQSFSQTCSHGEAKKFFHPEDRARIFCVEGHRRGGNLSSENVRLCCEEQLRCSRRRSPTASPHRSPRGGGRECLVRSRPKDSRGGRPPPEKVAERGKSGQRMEASLSAEEQGLERGRRAGAGTARSASFSPTRKRSASTSSCPDGSRRGSSSPARGSPSPGTSPRDADEGKPETEEPP